jgi:hypothetical protein
MFLWNIRSHTDYMAQQVARQPSHLLHSMRHVSLKSSLTISHKTELLKDSHIHIKAWFRGRCSPHTFQCVYMASQCHVTVPCTLRMSVMLLSMSILFIAISRYQCSNRYLLWSEKFKSAIHNVFLIITSYVMASNLFYSPSHCWAFNTQVINGALGVIHLRQYISELWLFLYLYLTCYKPEGHRFETRWGEWFLSIYLILPAALGPGVYSASNRNEYQKHKNNVSGE